MTGWPGVSPVTGSKQRCYCIVITTDSRMHESKRSRGITAPNRATCCLVLAQVERLPLHNANDRNTCNSCSSCKDALAIPQTR